MVGLTNVIKRIIGNYYNNSLLHKAQGSEYGKAKIKRLLFVIKEMEVNETSQFDKNTLNRLISSLNRILVTRQLINIC
jgi:hypothetical protein